MPKSNQLANETSPYLLQHKDNLVHWLPWNDQALELAKVENKPILLSVGYAACHWCHVMAHECFEDKDIAALMNKHFVNIKVDREERPDVDTIYQTAQMLINGHGGWPLTVFLTPQGEPFWGGTYFPPTPRHGLPGFPDILHNIAQVWRQDPGKIRQRVDSLKEAMEKASQNLAGEDISVEFLNEIAAQFLEKIDHVHGGVGQAPKFPQVPTLKLLFRAWKRTGNHDYLTAVTNTARHMCQGGIYDHLAGGFARYSVDDQWLVPHFEKMLYDNAEMIDLLTLCFQETKEPLFEIRVRETVEWVLREMIAEPSADGSTGFASTLDADSEGIEGKYYVWHSEEIDDVLGQDTDLFKSYYDVSSSGNWESTNILNRRGRLQLADDDTELQLRIARQKVFERRQHRVSPNRDDKVLADWNGQMIASLARSGFVFKEQEWIDAAISAFEFVSTHMVEGQSLYHSWRNNKAKNIAMLDDYAHMSSAALCLYQVTGERGYLDQAIIWVKFANDHFWDESTGGYFFTSDAAADLIHRTKSAGDNATPNGNGVMVNVHGQLFSLTGDDSYHMRAVDIVRAFSGELHRNFFALCTLLNSSEDLNSRLEIVIIGQRQSNDIELMLEATKQVALPGMILTILNPGDLLPNHHPAAGKTMIDGRPTAYVCRGRTCQAPITEPHELAGTLAQA